MPKRIADHQLTMENWEEEREDKEETLSKVGIPQASAENMKGRVIKVAKRKGIAEASGSEPVVKNAFAGFSGFGTFRSQSSTFATFPTTSTKLESKENGTKETTTTTTKKSDEYYAKLRALNESVSAWIKQHVDNNPLCILTPVFKDYEKHLETVEKLNTEMAEESKSISSAGASLFSSASDGKIAEHKHVSFDLKAEKKDDAVAVKPSFSFSTGDAQKPPAAAPAPATGGLFSFGTKLESQSDSKILSPKFSFGLSKETAAASDLPKTSTSLTEAPKFSFGVSASGSASGGFSFGGMTSNSSGTAKPFSFATGASTSAMGGTTTTTATAGSSAGGEDDEYVPPKPEVVEVKEDGASYSKKCKLFWMVDSSWKERGLGNLHLKPLESGKVQLVMRANTNLGNVILNILLNESIPISRSGKNMVNLICIPNPPFDPKAEQRPEKLLLKVKTSEDADELYDKLQEAKK